MPPGALRQGHHQPLLRLLVCAVLVTSKEQEALSKAILSPYFISLCAGYTRKQ